MINEFDRALLTSESQEMHGLFKKLKKHVKRVTKIHKKVLKKGYKLSKKAFIKPLKMAKKHIKKLWKSKVGKVILVVGAVVACAYGLGPVVLPALKAGMAAAGGYAKSAVVFAAKSIAKKKAAAVVAKKYGKHRSRKARRSQSRAEAAEMRRLEKQYEREVMAKMEAEVKKRTGQSIDEIDAEQKGSTKVGATGRIEPRGFYRPKPVTRRQKASYNRALNKWERKHPVTNSREIAHLNKGLDKVTNQLKMIKRQPEFKQAIKTMRMQGKSSAEIKAAWKNSALRQKTIENAVVDGFAPVVYDVNKSMGMPKQMAYELAVAETAEAGKEAAKGDDGAALGIALAAAGGLTMLVI